MKEILIILTLLFFVFIFLRRNKNKVKLSAPKRDTSNWHEFLLKHVLFYKKLTPSNQIIFRKRMTLFLEEIYIDCIGFEQTEKDVLFVAASAVIPVFRFKEWHYNNLTSVIIYPNHFNERLEFGDQDEGKTIGGMVGNGKLENQMLLSRKALHNGFQNKTDKHNTAIHEFVHLLDKTDGAIDGIPATFLSKDNVLTWIQLMYTEMEAINNNKSDIRNYGGTKQAEFFAVVSEYFFERPNLLKRKHPELYKMLLACFTPNNK